MIDTTSINAQLNQLLDDICMALQLTATQYDIAEERYQAIGTWLSEPNSPLYLFRPDIYPQGSVRLQTTVKPLARLEYDLDLVCLLQLNPQFHQHPMAVYDMVEARLKANGLYRGKVERYKRCLRINYANEFHLDITPAYPDPQLGGTCILVPDRKIERWKPSNPISYAEWFDKQTDRLVATFVTKRIEPLPPNGSANSKAPLRRVVQLLKRHRDVVFKEDENAPRSIALTTLAAYHYGGQVCTTDALVGILDNIVAHIASMPGVIEIPNPSNSNEKFSEAWENNPAAYRAFVDFMYAFQRRFHELLRQTGIANIANGLNTLFGESVTTKAIEAYTDRMNQARHRNQVHFNKVGVGLTAPISSTRPVPKNTFYGQ